MPPFLRLLPPAALVFAMVVPVVPALADSAMRIIPPDATFSDAGFGKIDALFKEEVSSGRIAGANVLVFRRGKEVFSRSFGKTDVKTGEPMTPRTIFRIHSMTKPVTSVAALMLIDDGKIKLDDPVSKFIPSFAKARVGVESKSENGDPVLRLVPVDRPITIRDLLRHSSGITYGFYGKGLVRNAYGNADLFADGLDNSAVAEKIAQLPLAEQPGTVWDYGHSTDVLVRVIEVASGQSLYQFEKQRLFDPLGMKDTVYYVRDPAQHLRIAEPVPSDNDFRTGSARNPRLLTKWESGGGGLMTTMEDFGRFMKMILYGGQLAGKRYLSLNVFKEMVTNAVAPATDVKRGEYYFPGDGFGFGLGFGVRTEAGKAKPPPPGSLGELKWDGAGGTYFWIDRAQDMFAVLLIQSPSERGRIQPMFKKLVYEALN